MNELNRTILITIIVTRMLMMVGAVQQQQNALDMSSRNKSVNSLSGKELKVVIGQVLKCTCYCMMDFNLFNMQCFYLYV